RVDGRRELAGLALERDGRVEEPRTVEMNGGAGRMRDLGDRGDRLRRAARSAMPIVRVLDADERRPRQVDVRGADALADLVRCEEPTLGLDGPHLHAAERRGTRDLVVVDVAVEIADDFLAGAR